jgi:tetratricopeptide (TPR) repeat protein
MHRIRRLLAISVTATLGLMLSTASVTAQSREDMARCADDGTTFSPDQQIAGCSAVIASAKLRGKRLSNIYYNRGITYQNKKDNERALADYDEAIRLDPKKDVAFNNRGRIYQAKGDHTRALADFSEAIRIDSKAARFYYNRGISYQAKQDSDHALADYNAAIALDPKYTKAYYNRGLLHLNKGEHDRAIRDYTNAIRLDPTDPDAFNDRGLSFRAKGDPDRAITEYNEALRLQPKHRNAFSNRGRAYLDKGEADRAIADFNEAIAIDPKFGRAYSNRALAFEDKFEYDRATADFNEAIRLDPSSNSYFDRGLARFNRGDVRLSAEDFLRSNDLQDYAYAMLWRFLARAHLKEDGGGELSASAARLKNKDWPYAVIDFYLGRRSIEELRNSATTADERCEVSFYGGEWRLLRDDKAAALTDLQAAIDTCPKSFIEYRAAIAEKKRLERQP